MLIRRVLCDASDSGNRCNQPSRRFGDHGRNVFGRMTSGGKHVWMGNDLGRAVADTRGEALLDRRLGELHMCDVNDQSRRLTAQTLGDVFEHSIRVLSRGPVVDNQERLGHLKNIHPSKVVQLNDKVEVMILEVDEDKRRISLGLKQLTENPWQVFAHKYKEGDKIEGEIKTITDFGVFIGLEGQIDGLVHLNDVSWEEDEEAVRILKKGEKIQTIILSIDEDRERISLGIKQLLSDAFNEFTTSNKKGAKVSGKVINFDENRITLELSEGVTGALPQKDFINSSANEPLNEGLELDVIIANINSKEREIILSLRALEKQEERGALKDNEMKNKEIEEASKSNLGDIIKAEMQEKENE